MGQGVRTALPMIVAEESAAIGAASKSFKPTSTRSMATITGGSGAFELPTKICAKPAPPLVKC